MVSESEFRWVPGIGPDKSAMANLRRHFERPSTPPGEAWFMGEKRKLFTEFVGQSMTEVPVAVIQDYLFEMTSGLENFSGMEEEVKDWISWFKYMLVFLVERGHEAHIEFLLESTITTFIRVYGAQINPDYPGFQYDVFSTLGQGLMNPELWNERGESCTAAGKNWLSLKDRAVGCNGAISASIFFCLLYLPPSRIAGWTESLIKIESPYFKTHFLIWLVSAIESFQGATSLWLRSIENAPYSIDWGNSFLLSDENPKIPTESMKRFLYGVRKGLSKDRMSKWSAQISEISGLKEIVEQTSLFAQVSEKIPALR